MAADAAVFAVADAIGADVLELAPADEGHFDGASIALMAASAITGAVGSGILAAFAQAAQNGTGQLISKVTEEIRRRLSRQAIQPKLAGELSTQDQDASIDTAAQQFESAATKILSLETALQQQLAAAAASAAGNALRQLGLSHPGATRVEAEVEIQLHVSIRLLSSSADGQDAS
jgi:hypothetical protein